jgi:hypothetical protein
MSLSPSQFGKLFQKAPGNVLNDPDYVPPAPGETQVPPDTMRMMHYTHPDNSESIRKNGLLRSAGKGHTYGEPDLVWGAIGTPDAKTVNRMAETGKHFVETWVRPDQLDIGRPVSLGRNGKVDDRVRESMRFLEERNSHVTLLGDLPPSQIMAVHEPWHSSYRYMSDAGMRDRTLEGEYDSMIDDDEYRDSYGRAIKKIKREGPYSRLSDEPKGK